MKKYYFIGSLVFIFTFSSLASEQVKVIKMNVKKINNVAHWVPSPIRVSEGEKVKFEVTYDLEGGFPFHDFSINSLDVHHQIPRNKTVEIPVNITLKPGTYEIRCMAHHPGHVDAQLIVEKTHVDKQSSNAGAKETDKDKKK